MFNPKSLVSTPAPPVEYENDTGPGDEGYTEWWQVGRVKFPTENEALFYATVCIALEIALRRGWGVTCITRNNGKDPPARTFCAYAGSGEWPDPFTAFVKAEEYVCHVS